MAKFTLDVPDKLINEFDEATKNDYNTRAEAIRAAMRKLINELVEES
ncbi:unnamed protein product [marine sediment metagenome]|uniref:Ribbon-helix-helix protein CopG domain-containing protein n=1 Tax=marine sediment metagenome TaxID=412755 RepID=X1QHT2_9ZZZZ